jgi:hypothetical protein
VIPAAQGGHDLVGDADAGGRLAGGDEGGAERLAHGRAVLRDGGAAVKLTSGRRVAISLPGLLLGFVLITVALRAVPPSREEQLATAHRLEALIARMDELGLDGWQDCATCQPIEIRPGASPAPLPPGETQFEALKAATEGVIPNGRLVVITTLAGPGDPDGRVVQFTAVARSMVGSETGHDLWLWTWYEEGDGSPTPNSINDSWDFEAVSAPESE